MHQSHREAAEHNERGDSQTDNWHSERALEHADQAYKLAKQAHSKWGRIESL